ncbi:2-hydroxyisoflavanone dehydratase-like [Carya illinoinensis]|nr:2-hydroxyisoflavanone dehydratase-like [Carya illinoinensis]
MASMIDKEVEMEILRFIRIYKDGSIDRLLGSPRVPPSPDDQDPETCVSSKDIIISQDPTISARLYLPKLDQAHLQRLPILVYFHGGGFFFESAFSRDHQRFLNSLVAQAQVVAISVEYRLAPEHLLPICYEDCWAALQWVASNSIDSTVGTNYREPWLSHGDFKRFFIGGDSAGANIVHNMAIRAGVESLPGDVKIVGAFLNHPYFWSSNAISELSEMGQLRASHVDELALPSLVWNFVYPSAPGGIDNPMINPTAPGAPSLAGLGCSRLLVTVAEMDVMRNRALAYYDAVQKSNWEGEVELVRVDGEDHAFQILNLDTQNAKNLVKRLASFLN